mgnify:CR=1 FL=1
MTFLFLHLHIWERKGKCCIFYMAKMHLIHFHSYLLSTVPPSFRIPTMVSNLGQPWRSNKCLVICCQNYYIKLGDEGFNLHVRVFKAQTYCYIVILLVQLQFFIDKHPGRVKLRYSKTRLNWTPSISDKCWRKTAYNSKFYTEIQQYIRNTQEQETRTTFQSIEISTVSLCSPQCVKIIFWIHKLLGYCRVKSYAMITAPNSFQFHKHVQPI